MRGHECCWVFSVLTDNQIGMAVLHQPVIEFQLCFDGRPANFFKIAPHAVELSFGNTNLFVNCCWINDIGDFVTPRTQQS